MKRLATIIALLALSGCESELDRPTAQKQGFTQLAAGVTRVDDPGKGISCYFRNTGQFSCVRVSP